MWMSGWCSDDVEVNVDVRRSDDVELNVEDRCSDDVEVNVDVRHMMA